MLPFRIIYKRLLESRLNIAGYLPQITDTIRVTSNDERLLGSVLDSFSYLQRVVYTMGVASSNERDPIPCERANILQHVKTLNGIGLVTIMAYIGLATSSVLSACEKEIFCTPSLTVALRSIVHTLFFFSLTNLSFFNCIGQDDQIDFAKGTMHRVGPLVDNKTQQLIECDIKKITPFDHIFARSSCFSTEESILISLFLLACSLFTLLEWRCKPTRPPADTMRQPVPPGPKVSEKMADANAGLAAMCNPPQVTTLPETHTQPVDPISKYMTLFDTLSFFVRSVSIISAIGSGGGHKRDELISCNDITLPDSLINLLRLSAKTICAGYCLLTIPLFIEVADRNPFYTIHRFVEAVYRETVGTFTPTDFFRVTIHTLSFISITQWSSSSISCRDPFGKKIYDENGRATLHEGTLWVGGKPADICDVTQPIPVLSSCWTIVGSIGIQALGVLFSLLTVSSYKLRPRYTDPSWHHQALFQQSSAAAPQQAAGGAATAVLPPAAGA